MPMAEENHREPMAEQARLAASVLAQGRSLDRWSLLFTGFALAALLLGNGWSPAARVSLLAAVLLGVLQKYYSLRVGLDRDLFCFWAERWQQDGANPDADMAGLDRSLAAFGLKKSAGGTDPRSLPGRARGALGLFLRQAVAWILQAVLLFAAFAIKNFVP
jgi:hypothetical protein